MPTDDTRYDISRRSVLLGLGTIGVASAGAGLGTTAFFSDEEELQAALEAGRLDLLLDYRAEYYPWDDFLNDTYPRAADRRFDTNEDGQITSDDEFGPVYVVGQAPDLRYASGNRAGQVLDPADWAEATRQINSCGVTVNNFPVTIQRADDGSTFDVTVGGGELPTPGSDAAEYFLDNNDPNIYVDGMPQVMFDLNDVKPKDAGETTISMHLCVNDAYLWTQPFITSNVDSGIVEPEDQVNGTLDNADGTRGGDLADYVHLRIWNDDNCNNRLDAGVQGEADVMIVLDRSGSMNSDTNDDATSSKWNGAKDGAVTLIDALGPGANVGLVSYADSATLNDSLGTPRADVKSTIQNDLSTGGLTNITDAIQTAQSELSGSNGRSTAQKIMVLLTNGSPTAGTPQDPRSAATSAKTAGTDIYGIAYGSGANENVIEDISSLPKIDDDAITDDDEFAFLSSDISDVQSVFASIAQQIAGEIVIWEGTLNGLVADLSNLGLDAVPLDAVPERACALPDPMAVDPFPAGLQCLAFEWYVPCELDELRALGSCYTLQSDAAEGGAVAGEVAGSMFNELVDRGVIASDGSDFDINIAQTDQVEFGARFAAVQARHNMSNPSPFAGNGNTGP